MTFWGLGYLTYRRKGVVHRESKANLHKNNIQMSQVYVELQTGNELSHVSTLD